MQQDELNELDLLEPDEVEEFCLQIVGRSGRRQQLDQSQAELGQRHSGRTFCTVKLLEKINQIKLVSRVKLLTAHFYGLGSQAFKVFKPILNAKDYTVESV